MPMSAQTQPIPPSLTPLVPDSCSSLRPLRLLPFSLCNNSFFSDSLFCTLFSPLVYPAPGGATKFFRFRTYGQTPRFAVFWPKSSAYNLFRINTCENSACNYLWNQHLQKNRGWVGSYVN